MIAFTGVETEYNPIEAVLDSGTVIRLSDPPPGAIDSYPRFSPTGNRLAFFREGVNGAELIVVNIKGKNSKILLTAEGCCHGLDWLPDGRTLIVSRLTGGHHRLWTVDTVNKVWSPVPGILDATNPVVDAQSGIISFNRTRTDRTIWRKVIDSPLQEFTIFVDSPRSDHSATISPDGKHLAFVSNRTGEDQLWLKQLPDGKEEVITRFRSLILSSPKWSPDGERLIVGVFNAERRNIFLVDPRDHTFEALTEFTQADAAGGHWRSDGESIIFYCSPEAAIWNLCETRLDSPGEVNIIVQSLPEPEQCLYVNSMEENREWLFYTSPNHPGVVNALDLDSKHSTAVISLQDGRDIQPHSVVSSRVLFSIEDNHQTRLALGTVPWAGDEFHVNDLETTALLEGAIHAEIADGYVYITREQFTGSQIELMTPDTLQEF